MSKLDRRKRGREAAERASAVDQPFAPGTPSSDPTTSESPFAQSQHSRNVSSPSATFTGSDSLSQAHSSRYSHQPHASQPKVAIPALPRPKGAEPSPKSVKKGRTAHACENCRRAKTGCSGEQPCARCKASGEVCLYDDGKRVRERKQLSKLSRDANILSQRQTYITNALQRIKLDTTLSTEGMRAAIDDVLAMGYPDLHEKLTLETPEAKIAESDTGNFEQSQASMAKDEVQDDQSLEDDEDRGSTGSLDVTTIDADRDETRPTGHMGKSSAVSWAKRTAEECRQSNQQPSFGWPEPDYIPPSYHTEDSDIEQIDLSNINMYELPQSDLSDYLVMSYFNQVHNTLPILDGEGFIEWYTGSHKTFHSGSDPPNPDELNWLGQLNLIFAIMSYYTRLTNMPQGKHTDHLVYYTRARMLCLDGRILYQDARVSTISALGLLCLYYVATCRLNRAWTICGIAIRSSLTLGLHVRSEVEDIPDIQREHRVRLWWSLYSLECSLNELTGRPTCISDRDISTREPLNMKETIFQIGQGTMSGPYDRELLSQPSNSHQEWAPVISDTAGSIPQNPHSLEPRSSFISSSTFFIYRTRLCLVSHEIVTHLYSASTTHETWGDVQKIIRKIDEKLHAWQDSLPSELDVGFDTYERPDPNDPFLHYRTGLAMLYNSSRMILFRPCLCRFQGGIGVSRGSRREFSQEAIEFCVGSARRMINLITWSNGNMARLYQISPWWSTLHYLCEALSVLMLELAVRTQHMPDDTAYILDDAKKGVRCLSAMASQSISARKAWEIFDHLLRSVAPLNHWSVFDMPLEAPIPPGYNWRQAQITQNPLPGKAPVRFEQQYEDHQLSRSNLQEYEHNLFPVSSPQATATWTDQPQSFQPFPEESYPPSEQPGNHRNHLNHAEALNRFSTMGSVHGHYDDDWMQLFAHENAGQDVYPEHSFGTNVTQSFSDELQYPHLEPLSGTGYQNFDSGQSSGDFGTQDCHGEGQ